MTKKEAAPTDAVTPVKSTDEMMLNFGKGKYTAIPMAALWAKELKKREENRHLTPAELLDAALRDVLGGKVNWNDLRKAGGVATIDDEPAAKSE